MKQPVKSEENQHCGLEAKCRRYFKKEEIGPKVCGTKEKRQKYIKIKLVTMLYTVLHMNWKELHDNQPISSKYASAHIVISKHHH